MLDSKIEMLNFQLLEADRRYNLSIERITPIIFRIHELEYERNQVLRRNLIAIEKEKTNNVEIKKHLQKELSKLSSLDYASDNDSIYCEIIQGYRSMSRRKNELQQERNQIVKDIENEENKN